MPDDLEKAELADHRRIDMDEPYEVRHWTQKFGVDTATLRRVIEKVGPIVQDVERELKR